MAVDHTLDRTFVCYRHSFITVEVSLGGFSLNNRHDSAAITVTALLTANIPQQGFHDVEDDILSVTIGLSADVIVEAGRSNWVGWSKIGHVIFQQDMVNDSGYRMLGWNGYIYDILQLDKSAVIYGSGGITAMHPIKEPAPAFGFEELSQIGMRCKGAVCGTKEKHFYLDKVGCLWMLTVKGLTRLGFEEFLEPLTNPILLFDEVNDRVHISDALSGYILTTSGLGGGYVGLTGVQYKAGVLITTAPSVLSAPPTLLMVTDIVDFGYRAQKTIEIVEVGTDNTELLQVAVDYRFAKEHAFATSPWFPVNNEGLAYPRVAGIEFRFRVRNLVYDPIDVDYLNIHYKTTDKRGIRGPIGSIRDDRTVAA